MSKNKSNKETKVCPDCEKEEITLKRVRCSKCYQKWYNKNKRDPESERVRQKKYRLEHPEKSMLYRFKHSAKKERIPFNLTSKWLKEKLDKGVCEASGLPIVSKPYVKGDRGRRTFYAASLDRIDNTLGYTQENCRMVCWGYNLTKNNYTDRDVHAFAISTTLQFVHKNMQKELLKLLPDHCLEYFPSGNKHAKVIKEIQVGG